MTAYPFDGTQPCMTTDPECWFPEVGGSPKFAISLCHTCDFETACLEWALSQPTDAPGVFGGMTERQRRRLRQERGDAA